MRQKRDNRATQSYISLAPTNDTPEIEDRKGKERQRGEVEKHGTFAPHYDESSLGHPPSPPRLASASANCISANRIAMERYRAPDMMALVYTGIGWTVR
jgi:hypothetical protein